MSPGAVGLELLENAAATAAGMFAIILMFGPVSGGHFNPVVSFADAAFGGLRWRDPAVYLPVQVAGCIGGAVLANLMFAQAGVSISANIAHLDRVRKEAAAAQARHREAEANPRTTGTKINRPAGTLCTWCLPVYRVLTFRNRLVGRNAQCTPEAARED